MKRAAYNKLVEWKNSETRKPLVLRGARQVGKTWLLQEFGKNEYDNLIYVNMELTPEIDKVFEPDLEPHRIIRALETIFNTKINPGSSLIVFDEVQSVPKALTSLKYFCENAPEYHIAVAGSLLGIALHEGTSFPVGKVNFIDILPMNLSEFVLANGNTSLSKIVSGEDKQKENLDAFHPQLVEYLKNYMIVGGMPSAVQEFINNAQLNRIREIQNEILSAYELDFSKHAPKNDIAKIGEIYNTVPSCLSQENKKFMFGAIKESARYREYESALAWCEDTGLVSRVTRVNKVETPLDFYSDRRIFKLFVSDIGLLGAKLNVDPVSSFDLETMVGNYKGALAEQFVFQELRSVGIKPFYYSQDDSRGEVDFIIERNGKAVPIEVKSGKNLSSTSLKNLVEKNDIEKAIKFSILPYKENDKIINMPLYLAEGLGED